MEEVYNSIASISGGPLGAVFEAVGKVVVCESIEHQRGIELLSFQEWADDLFPLHPLDGWFDDVKMCWVVPRAFE